MLSEPGPAATAGEREAIRAVLAELNPAATAGEREAIRAVLAELGQAAGRSCAHSRRTGRPLAAGR